MLYTRRSDLMDFAVIKVDSIEKNGNIYNNKFDYIVRGEDIEEYTKFIKALFNEYNISVRVYLSGFVCLPDSYLWSKQEITKQIMNVVNEFNNSIQSVRIAKK